MASAPQKAPSASCPETHASARAPAGAPARTRAQREEGAPPTLDASALLDVLADALAERVAARVLERLAAAQPALPAAPSGLVDKATAAWALGVSTATLDRFARDGAPVHRVGARRRFDVAELRAWIEARGRRPAAPRALPSPRPDGDDDEVRELALAAGIRSR